MAHNRSELVGVEGEIEVAQDEGFVVFLLLGDHDVALLGLPETAPISLLLALLLFSLHRRLQLTLLLLAHLAPEEVTVGNGNACFPAVLSGGHDDLVGEKEALDALNGDLALGNAVDGLAVSGEEENHLGEACEREAKDVESTRQEEKRGTDKERETKAVEAVSELPRRT